MKQLLKEGLPAPAFSAKDVFGKTVTLSDYRNNYVLLAFMRYSGCPWCNLALHRLTLEYALLKKEHCEVIAFVQSSNEDIKANIYDRHDKKPPFAIIADPERKIYDKYGVQRSLQPAVKALRDLPVWAKFIKQLGFGQKRIDGDFFLVPALFLINKDDQTIYRSYYGANFYSHEAFTHIHEPLIFNVSR